MEFPGSVGVAEAQSPKSNGTGGVVAGGDMVAVSRKELVEIFDSLVSLTERVKGLLEMEPTPDACEGEEPSMSSTEKVPTLVDVLSIPHIAQNVASFLTFPEMKVATEVSIQMSKIFRQTRRFKETAVLVISNENKSLDTLLEKSTFEWQNVRLFVDKLVPHRLLWTPLVLQRILKNVDFLSIVVNPSHSENTQHAVLYLPPTEFVALLRSTPKLTYLQVNPEFFSDTSPEVIAPSDVTQLLQNLRHLDTLRWETKTSFPYDWYVRGQVNLNVKMRDAAGITNLFQLTHGTNRLQTLRFFDLPPSPHINLWSTFAAPLLRSNVATLQELSLWDRAWVDEEAKTLVFPQLKRLLSFNCLLSNTSDSVGNFLRRHSTLEELSLDWIKATEDQELWPAMTRISTLKKLQLGLQLNSSSFPTLNWSFLRSMTLLRDLSLEVTIDEQQEEEFEFTGFRILREIPASQLQRLSLTAYEDDCNKLPKFWWGWGDGGQVDEEEKRRLLRGFSGVRILTFDAVMDDDLIRIILSEFVHLEELGLTVRRLSFVGWEADSGGKVIDYGRVSLNNLKGLRSLNIVLEGSEEETSLATERLFQLTSLPKLRHFHLTGCKEVPEDFLVDFTNRHRELETITAKFLSEEAAGKFLATMKRSGHGLRKVIDY